MSKVIEFPANRIVKGTHVYCPELGQRKVSCQLESSLSHDGKHYYIDTPLTLKGRGITLIKTYESKDLTSYGQRKVGWNEYKVTHNAYDKLENEYSISRESLLD